MKDICVKLIVIIGWAMIFVALPVFYIIPVPGLDLFSEVEIGTAPVFAAEQELKAGMIDPKTGKKIKYWVAPMNPSYIRDKPGKSPMGMDLVPVYEEEGEQKEPASTIRIDPVTMQNMGVASDPHQP